MSAPIPNRAAPDFGRPIGQQFATLAEQQRANFEAMRQQQTSTVPAPPAPAPVGVDPFNTTDFRQAAAIGVSNADFARAAGLISQVTGKPAEAPVPPAQSSAAPGAPAAAPIPGGIPVDVSPASVARQAFSADAALRAAIDRGDIAEVSRISAHLAQVAGANQQAQGAAPAPAAPQLEPTAEEIENQIKAEIRKELREHYAAKMRVPDTDADGRLITDARGLPKYIEVDFDDPRNGLAIAIEAQVESRFDRMVTQNIANNLSRQQAEAAKKQEAEAALARQRQQHDQIMRAGASFLAGKHPSAVVNGTVDPLHVNTFLRCASEVLAETKADPTMNRVFETLAPDKKQQILFAAAHEIFLDEVRRHAQIIPQQRAVPAQSVPALPAPIPPAPAVSTVPAPSPVAPTALGPSVAPSLPSASAIQSPQATTPPSTASVDKMYLSPGGGAQYLRDKGISFLRDNGRG